MTVRNQNGDKKRVPNSIDFNPSNPKLQHRERGVFILEVLGKEEEGKKGREAGAGKMPEKARLGHTHSMTKEAKDVTNRPSTTHIRSATLEQQILENRWFIRCESTHNHTLTN